MAISLKELRRRGHSDDAIALAKHTQECQRRAGAPVDSLQTILSGRDNRRDKPPEDLTPRQLRKKGRVGGAAILLDQEALGETDVIRQAELRRMATRLKQIADVPKQLEFNFWKGNWSVSNEYWDTIRTRIQQKPLTTARKTAALAVLTEVIRHVGWETSACDITAAEIARLLRMQPADVSRALALLEDVRAIYRVAGSRSRKEKVIHLNPEGVYRGDINRHPAAVDKFATVVPFPSQQLSGGHQ